ncbi:MAG TPA: hypothetical protein VFF09_04310 [archaeon]|nr:hypothetical protein [archaeon]
MKRRGFKALSPEEYRGVEERVREINNILFQLDSRKIFPRDDFTHEVLMSARRDEALNKDPEAKVPGKVSVKDIVMRHAIGALERRLKERYFVFKGGDDDIRMEEVLLRSKAFTEFMDSVRKNPGASFPELQNVVDKITERLIGSGNKEIG